MDYFRFGISLAKAYRQGLIEMSEPPLDPPPQDEDEDRARRLRRRLTRSEQLQELADSGCDTWEEYRGER